jgi:hypothetical protein
MKINWLSKGLVVVVILFFLSFAIQPCIATVSPIRKIYKQIVYTCYTVTYYFIWVDGYEKIK